MVGSRSGVIARVVVLYNDIAELGETMVMGDDDIRSKCKGVRKRRDIITCVSLLSYLFVLLLMFYLLHLVWWKSLWWMLQQHPCCGCYLVEH